LSGLSKERSSLPASSVPVGLNVLKRDGSFQPFDRLKLVSSMIKAGASEQQATLVSNRVVNRLSTVPSHEVSGMVASSLSEVNPAASSQYTRFQDQKALSIQTSVPKPQSKIDKPDVNAYALVQYPDGSYSL
jgi:transcriptional regulator NrdR family protein